MNVIRRISGKCASVYYIYQSQRRTAKGSVLMLHGIDEKKSEYNISVHNFEELLRVLSSKNVIRLEDWEHSRNFYALTIDDVPESFYLNAFPLLKQYRIPFALFVSTSLLDTQGYITSKQLIEMSESDLCTVGSHGHSHLFVKDMSKREFRADLICSKETISKIINKSVSLYAFPYGSMYACGFTKKHIVMDVYSFGFGTVNCPITEPSVMPYYYLPRVNVDSTFINELKQA